MFDFLGFFRKKANDTTTPHTDPAFPAVPTPAVPEPSSSGQFNIHDMKSLGADAATIFIPLLIQQITVYISQTPATTENNLVLGVLYILLFGLRKFAAGSKVPPTTPDKPAQ